MRLWPKKKWLIFKFAALYFYDLTVSAFKIAWDVITVKDLSRPGTVSVPLSATSDAEITLISNLITFSPGTMVVGLSEDRKTLYVHAMFIEDEQATIQSIKEGVEQRVLEIMR